MGRRATSDPGSFSRDARRDHVNGVPELAAQAPPSSFGEIGEFGDDDVAVLRDNALDGRRANAGAAAGHDRVLALEPL